MTRFLQVITNKKPTNVSSRQTAEEKKEPRGRYKRTFRNMTTSPHTLTRMPTLSSALTFPSPPPDTQPLVWWEKTRLAVTLAIGSGWGGGGGREFFELDSYDTPSSVAAHVTWAPRMLTGNFLVQASYLKQYAHPPVLLYLHYVKSPP